MTTTPANGDMRSDVMKTGPDRAAARAMLYATGLNEADIRKPLVAVVHTWSNVSPCNLNLRDLAQDVAEGVRAAGANPGWAKPNPGRAVPGWTNPGPTAAAGRIAGPGAARNPVAGAKFIR